MSHTCIGSFHSIEYIMSQCDEQMRVRKEDVWVYETRICNRNEDGSTFEEFVQNRTARLLALRPWGLYLAPGENYVDGTWADISGNDVSAYSVHVGMWIGVCACRLLSPPLATLHQDNLDLIMIII